MAKSKIFDEILVGFEVECFLLPKRNKSIEDIKDLIYNLHNNIDIGDDGSLEDDEHYDDETGDCLSESVEIRTPPLPVKEGISLVQKVLSLVKKYGFTNETCSIHFNFSTLNDKYKKNFNAALFASHPIWREIGNQFDRLDNEYCINHAADYDLSNTKRFYENAADLLYACQDKYSMVNLQYLDDYNNGRIEIRGMGNMNYHKRFKEIKQNTHRILKLFKKTCELPTLPQEIKV